MSLSQYELQNAVERIDGYYMPRPPMSAEERFNHAKGECLANMRMALEQTESITFEQFAYAKQWPSQKGAGS
jgi:hypothetical protein